MALGLLHLQGLEGIIKNQLGLLEHIGNRYHSVKSSIHADLCEKYERSMPEGQRVSG